MNRVVRLFFGVVAASCAAGASVFAADVEFARDILPLLSDRCFQCHGPDAKEGRKGDLRLDDEADAKRDRDGYRVVVEGDASASELIRRMTTKDPDDRMPPDADKALSLEQVDAVRRWINAGARWGRHWAFEPVMAPSIQDAEGHPIDVLVSRRLAGSGLKVNPPAARETLARRLSLDLTGLPPTPEELTAFVADTSGEAWERYVRSKLDSPAYGERMAWDWLEAARYADSNGYQGDRERTMWPWRDWVVKAFNENLPYDRFTVWQLAGDLLPEPTDEQVLATGFCRNHMINGEGGRIAEENRVDYVFDMTETMGTVWLALTLNCSRCHDHKFDPLTQKDYYRLTAFFNQTPVDGKGGNAQTPPVLEVPDAGQRKEMDELNGKLRDVSAEIAARRQVLLTTQDEWERETLSGSGNSLGWNQLRPVSAKAKEQELKIEKTGGVLATGVFPRFDDYTVEYDLAPGNLTGLRLDAKRHPSMEQGGLSRNQAGNFVLTDIRFELIASDGQVRAIDVGGTDATYEQNGLKIAAAVDGDPKSGWGVWGGSPVRADHAAFFGLSAPVAVKEGERLRVKMGFNHGSKYHLMGHFFLSATDAAAPRLRMADAGLTGLLRVPPQDRKPEQEGKIREALFAGDANLAELTRRRSGLDGKLKTIRAAVPKVMVMRDREKPRETYLLERGLYNQPGEVVTATLPAALPQPEGGARNRLDLARWLVSPEHPLTARVAVNRFWQMLFGTGLVKTAEDFGVQGEYPVQRELLDWLAADFVKSGWDVKRLLATIVTSETYRRSSRIASEAERERDPENRLLARGPRFRLPSWMIRDQALAASGLLNDAVGGAPVYSYQPEGIWSEATFGKKQYQADHGPALYRRSLYTFWRRIVGPTMFFDSAKRQVCEVKPLRTNTPMHALTTLNDVTYVEAARGLAELVLRKEDDDAARIGLAARRVLARELSNDEAAVWRRSLDRARRIYGSDGEGARRLIHVGDSEPDGSLPEAETAAWTAVCLNLLNLDECLNKE